MQMLLSIIPPIPLLNSSTLTHLLPTPKRPFPNIPSSHTTPIPKLPSFVNYIIVRWFFLNGYICCAILCTSHSEQTRLSNPNTWTPQDNIEYVQADTWWHGLYNNTTPDTYTYVCMQFLPYMRVPWGNYRHTLTFVEGAFWLVAWVNI